ncbi:hypothetical protein Pla123a_29090 [Posidoniimonas polymericola]|uniref:DUF1365 domain-containing protein n=1 Tax=Posidoniimonas polymericola TaxID=2528002 RepID=A0A5C5YMQ6_9BACT|nr:DUF1365 domain-containing protein [Posidoniimonas polymericola]TWT76120.1 hypothetical protein Pla123a_29090 [Posidoniimonas polymericola]
MHSCLYEGVVAHRRRQPLKHRFRYPLAMAWLDLDELDEVVGAGRAIASSRWSLASHSAGDHLDGSTRDLREGVCRSIAGLGGPSPGGPIRVLTQLRWFGHYFSPLNLFYVYDASGSRVEQVLAEVNNTPWGERRLYLLSNANRRPGGDALRFEHSKDFHVSPFMGMDADYHWRLTPPGDQLVVALASCGGGHGRFDACMRLTRRPLTRRAIQSLAFRRPLATTQVLMAIYYQAFLLWWKKCPFYPHPQNLPSSP